MIKKVRAGIEQAFAAVRADVKNINSDGPDEKFNSAEGKINAAINMITGKYFSIRDLKGYAKESGLCLYCKSAARFCWN